jgi:hypothetical protein
MGSTTRHPRQDPKVLGRSRKVWTRSIPANILYAAAIVFRLTSDAMVSLLAARASTPSIVRNRLIQRQ